MANNNCETAILGGLHLGKTDNSILRKVASRKPRFPGL